MVENLKTLAQVQDAFPQEIDFYGIGKIQASEEKPEWTDSFKGIAFKLYSADPDIQNHTFVLLRDPDLNFPDPSMDEEMGNILTAKLSSYLTREYGESMMISAPLPLSQKALKLMKQYAIPSAEKLYQFFHGNRTIPFVVCIYEDKNSQRSSFDV
jgi:hypothetical protein